MSLLEPDKATTINRADWDHYMRPTPPLEGVFIPLDRSSSVDTVFYPYALLRLPRGTRCPSGSGEELKKETNYHLEMASQLKSDVDLSEKLLATEIGKIPAPADGQQRILTVLLIGGGKVCELIIKAAQIVSGAYRCLFLFSTSIHFGPQTTQALPFRITLGQEQNTRTSRSLRSWR